MIEQADSSTPIPDDRRGVAKRVGVRVVRASRRGASVAFVALLLSGCRGVDCGALTESGALHRLDTPEAAMAAVIESFRRDSASLFHYTLAQNVRRQFNYPTILATWSDIDARLGIDLRAATILTSEYLERTPFPPQPAARVAIEYPHPKGGTIVESFLFTLERDSDFDEPMPQWRLYFPYGPYQSRGHTLWIRPPAPPQSSPEQPPTEDQQ